ncbi:hypothetical protein MLD38_008311 [Melastoma candidum]|uniref:Uncharacterized protein n=1 Tax=Melastoma candidum TaxID=119954 RepID=A0ACB9RTV5_9MYRT|nr:hypothetical protein MLD38_008311 [Melastoma candidum]
MTREVIDLASRGEREERPHDPRGDRPDERRRERRGEHRGWKWRTGKGPDSYNLYDRKPDFRNNHGWSVAFHGKDYEPLHHTGIGVYLVNLTAGRMMAPHVNSTSTEYGVILKGTGTIRIGYPDGTPAMNKQVREGDLFWVPRYFPFC